MSSISTEEVIKPSLMYNKALYRLTSYGTYYKEDAFFKKYMFEVLVDLCQKNMSHDKYKEYRLFNLVQSIHYKSHCDYKSYCGIHLNRIRFKACNNYELFLKIYRYIQENKSDDEFHEYDQHAFDYSFVTEYEKTSDEYASMVKAIDDCIYHMDYVTRSPNECGLYWKEKHDPIIYV